MHKDATGTTTLDLMQRASAHVGSVEREIKTLCTAQGAGPLRRGVAPTQAMRSKLAGVGIVFYGIAGEGLVHKYMHAPVGNNTVGQAPTHLSAYR